MKRIRLQIQILPWDEPASQPSSSAPARQNEVRPWTQPEAADNTLQQLVDNIIERYGRIYVGRGILRVKELHDSWGSTLDLTDTVGDVFDDRSSSGDILTSICKVLRYPPQAAELYHSHRYASLLPESSARPQKRTLPPPVPIFESVQRPLRSVEMWDGDDGLSSQESANKRRKTHDVRALDDHMQARALPPSQLIGKAILDLSQSAGTQGSEHQVEDSQRSPQRKIPNPYGTPTSLPFNRPHDIPYANRTNETIPDSPTSKRSVAVEVSHAEKTKSESPELRLSVHEIAPLDHAEHRARENDTSLHEPVILEEQLGEMVPQSSQSHRDPVTKDSGQGFQLESPSERIQKPQVPQTLKSFSPATAWRGSYKSPPVARRTAYNVYDPIESDSEGFQEKQRMFHAKRLEVSKTPARNVALPQVNFEGSDHNKPHTGGAPCLQKLQSNSLGEHPRSPSVSRIIPPWEFVQQLIEAAAEDGNQLLSVQDPSPVIFESGAVDPSATHAVTGYKAVSPVNSRRSPKIDAQPEEPSISQKRPLYDMAVGQHPPFEIYIDPLEKAPPNGAKPLPTGDRTSGHRGVVKIHQQNADVHHHKNKPPPQPVERKSGVKQRNKMAQLDAQSAEVKSKTPPITHSMIELPRNAKEEEDKDSTQDFSNARSIVEGEALPHLNEERPRQPRTPSMAIPKSKKLKEQQLVEQAEKMMIAADGAKQLEAEKSKLKKTAPKKRIIPSIPAEVQKTSPRTPAQQTARKMSEQQQAAAIKFRQERFSSVLSGDSTTTKSCIAYNERRSSQVRSSSPANRENFSDRKRRTLTPLLPGSASSNLKSGNGIRSSPLSAKSSSSMGRPLRSAMKQPASALRRSVSQVSFGGSQIAPEAISSNHPILPVTRGQVVEPSVSEGSPSVMAAHKTLNTNKIQSKLNVTRDTKLKGRVNDPPNPAKPAPNKEHVISSDDDEDSASSYASREDVGYGVAKAGPSSKTKSMSGTTSTTNLSVSTSEVISSSIGPELQALKKGEGGMRSSTSAEASRPASASRPQTKSISRKPAEASETMSVTSSPSSESEDSSDDAQDTNASQLKMKPNTSNAAATLPPIEPALASQSSQISSTSKSTTDASASSGADASNQLHRETQAAAAPRGKRYSMKLRPDGRLLNGIRPANFRYPSLSQLKREAEGRNIRSSTSLANGASQKQTQMVADLDMSSESSDEDSVSDSSDGESEAKRKSHSGFVPGMKGLLKLISGANTGKT